MLAFFYGKPLDKGTYCKTMLVPLPNQNLISLVGGGAGGRDSNRI